MKYTFKVPPTAGMGSYNAACHSNYLETYRQNALWHYNHARNHDGLPPLSRMPRGTTYISARSQALRSKQIHGKGAQ